MNTYETQYKKMQKEYDDLTNGIIAQKILEKIIKKDKLIKR